MVDTVIDFHSQLGQTLLPMLVCHCQSVSDREIRAVVRSGARTRSQVARACRAGSRCGGCAPTIDQILETEQVPPPLMPQDGMTLLAAAGS